MPHLELSIVDAARRLAPSDAAPRALERWASVVPGAVEACLVLDADGMIVAASPTWAALFYVDDPTVITGQSLRAATVELVDFTEPPGPLAEAEAAKIPPLLAISSGQLARGLLRLHCPRTSTVCTLDAISTPIREHSLVVGSLSFFSKI